MNDVCIYGPKKEERKTKEKKGLGGGAIFGIVLLLVLVIGIAAWCVYAYRHPTSKSGLFFIEVKFFSVTLVTKNFLIASLPPGGWGTPLCGLYRYVRPQRVWFFRRFGHK